MPLRRSRAEGGRGDLFSRAGTLPLVLVGALRWATLPVMLTVCWALFGILEIGNLVEEPFTAVDSSTMVRRYVHQTSMMHLLPLTEVCRTIRRDVRSIAQYSQLGGNYSVPTIQQFPRVAKLPDANNTYLRELRTNVRAERTNSTKRSAGNTTNLNRGTAPPASAGSASQVVVLRSQLWWQGSDRSNEDV